VKRSVTVGASPERIELKMGAAQSGVEEDKKRAGWGQAREEKGSIDKIYTPVSSRARGLSKVSFFF
jgi:hypothetical protein